MTNRELELQGCKLFVCPNISLLDMKGKELGLGEKTIKKSREIAIEYLRVTYHRPKYTSIGKLLPVFTFIAAILNGEKRTQNNVAKVFGANLQTFRKWYIEITNELNYDRNLLSPSMKK